MAKDVIKKPVPVASGQLRRTLCVGVCLLSLGLYGLPLYAEEAALQTVAQQQDERRTLQGVVVDEQGESLPGASV